MMASMDRSPLGRRNYEPFAERYAKYAEVKAHNALYERPTTLSMLPPLEGLRVLDAGCGPGFYCEALLTAGVAEVVGADVTPAMLDLARARTQGRAQLHLADLDEPLRFVDDASFDLVIAPLVLDYIEDWRVPFAEFFRALRPGGVLVASFGHPLSDFLLVRDKHDVASNYHRRELFGSHWGGFGEPAPYVAGYRRSFGEAINAFCDAGFLIDRVVEAEPDPGIAEHNPRLFEELETLPCFMHVRARKPGA